VVGPNLKERQRAHQSFYVVCRFPQPGLAAFSCSFGAAPVATYRIVGTRGDLRSENCYEYRGDIEHTLTIDEKKRQRRFRAGDQFGPEILYFSDCVLRHREPEPSGYEGLADVRIIEALHRSIASGAPVDLEPLVRVQQPSEDREIRRPSVEEPPLVNAESPFQD